MRRTHRIGGALLLLGLVITITGRRAAAQGEDWGAIKRDYDAAFRPVPVSRLFTDPEAELRISRRAPFTKPARDEIEKTRARQKLSRAQVLAERRKREEIVRRIGAHGGPLASPLLIDAHSRVLQNIEIARENVDRHTRAMGVDINPGVDPGGVYWERWMRSTALPAANRVLRDERRLRDLILEECGKLRTPLLIEWFARNARRHEQTGTRERMARLLAAGGRDQEVETLGKIFADETKSWARIMILEALATSGGPAAARIVLGALGDCSWPVRSAAVAAVRKLQLRDSRAIDGLIAALRGATGHLRLEARNALAEATGMSFGLRAGEWKLWWDANRAGWVPLAAPAKVAPLDEKLPRLFGIPTASARIAIVVSRGKGMLSPVTRRPMANDGSPSPEPSVDAAIRIAAWEVLEGVLALPDDASFTVLAYGSKVHPWSRKLKVARKDSAGSAARFVAKFEPTGGSNLRSALEAALRLGVPRKIEDVALAGEGEVDTIFVVGGAWHHVDRPDSNSAGKPGGHRIGRFRRVVVHFIGVRDGHKILAGLAPER